MLWKSLLTKLVLQQVVDLVSRQLIVIFSIKNTKYLMIQDSLMSEFADVLNLLSLYYLFFRVWGCHPVLQDNLISIFD